MASKLAKTLGVAAGSAALIGAPSASQAIPEVEPNDLFPGQAVGLANVITGQVSLCPVGTACVDDPVDFFNYSGLVPGSFFDIFVELTAGNGDVFTDVSDSGNTSQLDFDTLSGSGSSTHLNGVVPADGQLVVQVSYQDTTRCCFEGYRITLATPMPDTLALVALGLVGLGGLHVARRRKKAA